MKKNRGRREAGQELIPVSPGTCEVPLDKSLSLSGMPPIRKMIGWTR